MLVDTMSYEEIGKEMSKDAESLSYRVSELLKKTVKLPAFKNHSTFPIYFLREVESNRRNKYIIRILIPSKKALKTLKGIQYESYLPYLRQGEGIFLYGRVYDSHNKSADNIVAEYHPHFFRRYAERTGFDGSHMETIKKVLSEPDAISTLAEFEGTTYIAQAFTDGVGLGKIVNGTQLMRTFVTYDLLTPSQKHLQESMTEYIAWSDQYRARKGSDDIEKYAGLIDAAREKDAATVVFWKAFARYSLKKEVEVIDLEDGRYKLIEKTEERKEEKSFMERVKHKLKKKPQLDEKVMAMVNMIQDAEEKMHRLEEADIPKDVRESEEFQKAYRNVKEAYEGMKKEIREHLGNDSPLPDNILGQQNREVVNNDLLALLGSVRK